MTNEKMPKNADVLNRKKQHVLSSSCIEIDTSENKAKSKIRSSTNEKMPKNAEEYKCEICDFVCSKYSNYKAHLNTRKHKIRSSTNEKCQKMPDTEPRVYTCECGKSYSHASSLWNHKQRCLRLRSEENVVMATNVTPESSLGLDKDKVIIDLLQQNNQLQKHVIELSKNGGNNSHNTITHTNSHNKTFNLQFFLNETCKDAMNIQDFIKSLQLNIQDLESVGELGYAEGISRMFVKGLNELEVTKRPIHCSDLKREVIHIKDKDVWEKDTSNQDKLKKAIKDLSNKNIMLFDDWQKQNPGYDQYDSKKNDIYLKMLVQTMGPADDVAERRDFGKIIRKIAKTTIIDKEQMEVI